MAFSNRTPTDLPTPPMEEGSWRPPSNDGQLANVVNHPSGPVESAGEAYIWAGKQFNDASQIIAQAMKNFELGCTLSNATEERLQTRIKELERDQITLKNAKNRAVREAAALREIQGKHDAELAKSTARSQNLEADVRQISAKLEVAEKEKEGAIQEAVSALKKQAHAEEELMKEKANHMAHVRKVKDQLTAEHAKEIRNLKANLEKEKMDFQRTVDVPKDLRKDIERLKIENKSLQKKADGNKAMTKDFGSLKQEVADYRKKLATGEQKLRVVEDRLAREIQKSKELEGRNAAIESSYAIAVNKIESQDKVVNFKKKFERQDKVIANLKEEIVDLKREVVGLTSDVNTITKDRDKYSTWWSEDYGKLIELRAKCAAEAPLVQVGIKIRQRFMEKESSSAIKDPFVITLGNHAAHLMDGAADSAVFKLGHWTEELHGHKFKAVYELDVVTYTEATFNWESFLRATRSFHNLTEALVAQGNFDRANSLHIILDLHGSSRHLNYPQWVSTAGNFLEEFVQLIEGAKDV